MSPSNFPIPHDSAGGGVTVWRSRDRERIARNLLPHITLRQALGSLPPISEPGVPARYTSRSAAGEYDAYMRTPWRDAPNKLAVAGTRAVRDHERVPITSRRSDSSRSTCLLAAHGVTYLRICYRNGFDQCVAQTAPTCTAA